MSVIKSRKYRKRVVPVRPASITFSIDPELLEQLEEMAESLDVSRSEMLRRIIRFHYALHTL